LDQDSRFGLFPSKAFLIWAPSLPGRVCRGRLQSPECEERHQLRKMRGNGENKRHGKTIFIGCVQIGEPV
jgi:hypothetical protein